MIENDLEKDEGCRCDWNLIDQRIIKELGTTKTITLKFAQKSIQNI